MDRNKSQLHQQLQMARECWKNGIARGALIIINDPQLDTHAAEQAKESPKIYRDVVGKLVEIMEFMKTPHGAGSLLDVTSILISSEFSRTMRQQGNLMDRTGTDHNPLSNMVLVAGKGLKKGLVVGESDLKTAEEVAKPSVVHKKFDQKVLKVMALPFDFKTMTAIKNPPDEYSNGDYLTYSSLINTVYKLFGVEQKHWRKTTEREGGPSPVVNGLLS